MNSKVKIHMYMKEEKNYLYDWQKQSKTVYVDNKLISTIKRGENKEIELELEPGNHCITVEDANVLKTKTKQNFELKSDTTDCYVAFGYVKTIYSRFYKFCFLSLEQFNKNTFSNEQEKNVKLTVHRIHGFAQKKNYSVTIDDIETKKSAGEDIELYIAPGKHMIQYETVYTTAYSEIDIPKCNEYSITMEENQGQMSDGFFRTIKVLSEGETTRQDKTTKQVECIIKREKRIIGCAAKTRLEIDNDIKIDLKNGETKSTTISTGKHKIVVIGVESNTREFEVPENCNKVCINITKTSTITSIDIK